MRTEEEILARVRYLVHSEFNRRLDLLETRLPHRCVHNYQHPIDTRKLVEGERNQNYNRIGLPVLQQGIGLCRLGSDNPEEWGGTICDEPIDAKKCNIFTPLVSKQDLLKEFYTGLLDETWVSKNLPDVHVLFWVVGPRPLYVSWWKRVLVYFKVIKLEKPTPAVDLPKLLDGF